MRKSLIGACLLACSSVMWAGAPHLVVQRVNNQGTVQGSTFRLYCAVESGQSVQVVYGDQNNPLIIRSEGELYQHEYGGNTSTAVNAALADANPALKYDSWVTVGYENSTNNDLWELGVDFSGFATNSEMLVDNGGWFLVPTSAKCQPNENGLILLGQFTTNGTVSGQLNVQGRTGQSSWNFTGLKFTTENALEFGCNDKAAINYSPDAPYHDASACQYRNGAIAPAKPSTEAVAQDWSVFPNPLRDNFVHIQWTEAVVFGATKPTIQMIDANGRIVYKRDVQPGDIANNRMTLEIDLAAGSYQIIWTNGQSVSNKTLVVQK